ncbi:hypothetical protein AABB24_000379, partial [Solanum stoloniferum]
TTYVHPCTFSSSSSSKNQNPSSKSRCNLEISPPICKTHTLAAPKSNLHVSFSPFSRNSAFSPIPFHCCLEKGKNEFEISPEFPAIYCSLLITVRGGKIFIFFWQELKRNTP